MAKSKKNPVKITGLISIKVNLKKLTRLWLPVLLSAILIGLITIAYQLFIYDKYYPRTYAGDIEISFLTEGQAIRKVQANFLSRANQKLPFAYNQSFFEIDLAASSANLDYSQFISVLNYNKAQNPLIKIKDQFSALIFGKFIYPQIIFSLDKQFTKISQSVNINPQDAQLQFNEVVTSEGTPSAQIQVKEGINGSSLDKFALEKQISEYLLTGHHKMQLPTKTILPKITTEHVQKAKQALESALKEPIQLKFESNSWTIDAKQLLALIDLTSGENLLLDKDKTNTFLDQIGENIDQPVQEGLFEFNQITKRVAAFKASQEGRKLDKEKTFQLLTESLAPHGIKIINLPVSIVKPKIQTADVNSLGIKELLGRGISNFAGSIPNRIYNVNLTASKINGVLIPPGEIFSFNQTVGDISAATGFKQAYVIKEGRTVLDDGGGVCQDSTTLFRAVLNAGLPVIKRTAHAYRVGYYEQGFPPGLDATVFYPSVDFQFKNDTQHYILIQAYTAGLTLYVDLYGTSDGRVATLTKPIITNQTPPPAELRQDDPTLPRGQVKQVDWPAWGATVSFSRTVTRGPETLTKETFKSNYKAWQAVYLVGTKE